jgi:hypothetical protein
MKIQDTNTRTTKGAKKAGRGDSGKSEPEAGAKAPEESRAKVVKALLKNIEARLGEDVGKATLGDYIKLLQLQKDLDLDDPREIRVSWVDRPREEWEERVEQARREGREEERARRDAE